MAKIQERYLGGRRQKSEHDSRLNSLFLRLSSIVAHWHCNKDSFYPSYLKPPVRELQGDEERKFKRRLYWNRIFYAIFPMMRTVPLRSQQLFLKFGPHVRLTEAVTSEFVAKHDTIPVPRFLDIWWVGLYHTEIY